MIFVSQVMPYAKAFSRGLLHLSLSRTYNSARIDLDPHRSSSRAAIENLKAFLYLFTKETRIPYSELLLERVADFVAHSDAAGDFDLGFGGVSGRFYVMETWSDFPPPNYVLKERKNNNIIDPIQKLRFK